MKMLFWQIFLDVEKHRKQSLIFFNNGVFLLSIERKQVVYILCHSNQLQFVVKILYLIVVFQVTETFVKLHILSIFLLSFLCSFCCCCIFYLIIHSRQFNFLMITVRKDYYIWSFLFELCFYRSKASVYCLCVCQRCFCEAANNISY